MFFQKAYGRHVQILAPACFIHHAAAKYGLDALEKLSNTMPSRPLNLDTQHWYDTDTLPWSIPEHWKHWLLDTGSLTARLKKNFPGTFEVQVLFHEWDRPTPDERSFLSISQREQASIREVTLLCNGVPKVFARSILPASSLEGKNRQLLFLKDRPLGAFLFSQPDLKRGPIELTRTTDSANRDIWGRRSLFTLNHKPLAVCEYFLPEETCMKNNQTTAGVLPV
ncbi:chorismate lyase [Parendozoicomonas sp. Alg238-R29]|uniref:chorismate--pyruvate lyase family protein n=1 Tax=Parendozoicomonas sp. Alg238-R29 TaxID=2993446 RepID=UPI00248DBD47|nr:chorismate lyase [Parendozoicomonas sp. Alg238-R29]